MNCQEKLEELATAGVAFAASTALTIVMYPAVLFRVGICAARLVANRFCCKHDDSEDTHNTSTYEKERWLV